MKLNEMVWYCTHHRAMMCAIPIRCFGPSTGLFIEVNREDNLQNISAAARQIDGYTNPVLEGSSSGKRWSVNLITTLEFVSTDDYEYEIEKKRLSTGDSLSILGLFDEINCIFMEPKDSLDNEKSSL